MTKKAQYRVNQVIWYKGSFGAGPETMATIKGIGEKNGKTVYDLNDGHWCYESQIIDSFYILKG